VAVAGIAVPFAMGVVLANWLHPRLAMESPRLGFVLFFATALSITAIPILGRIMVQLGIQHTRLGVLTITAAAVDDVLGWILLAAVSALVRGGFEWTSFLLMVTGVALFVGAMFSLVRPIARKIIARNWSAGGRPTVGALAVLLIAALASASISHALGVFAAFGPFVLGAALSSQRDFADATVQQIRPLVYALLLPVFFTYTGLQTNTGSLDSVWLWTICGLVAAVATIGKLFGCGVAARVGGFSWSESACVAVMMNTRALMGLVAINIGRELGVVPPTVFTMLVLMAIATTLLTTPVLRRLLAAAQGNVAVQELNMVARL
jgi:Kef-type K+ transport system membrane component KefB